MGPGCLFDFLIAYLPRKWICLKRVAAEKERQRRKWCQTSPSTERDFSGIKSYKYIYEVVNLQPLKKRSFFCLIQTHFGGVLWGDDRNSVAVTIIQCFYGGAQENE